MEEVPEVLSSLLPLTDIVKHGMRRNNVVQSFCPDKSEVEICLKLET